MNLQDQIGALAAGVDQLIEAVAAKHAAHAADKMSATPPDVAPATSPNAPASSDAAPTQAVPAADADTDTHAQAHADAASPHAPANDAVTEAAHANAADTSSLAATADRAATAGTESEDAGATPPADLPTLQIGRPSQDEITMTIGGQTVSLHPLQVGQLIEELANARASMTPEVPPGIPPGWRFVSTKNPVMAVQKQSNGDRLLVLRHTGHGWVPFTFSPDMVIQMYMMLTQR
jgi:hypothetical protein